MPITKDSTIELPHVPSGEAQWRESYYFEFYDRISDIAFFSTIGAKPNKTHAGCLGVFIVQRKELYAIQNQSGNFDHTEDKVAVSDMEYNVIEPLRQWSLEYKGPIIYIPNGDKPENIAYALANPSESEPLTGSFQINFTGLCDPYFYDLSGEKKKIAANAFDGHIEQPGLFTGTLRIAESDGRELQISGLGERDRSWGVRDWHEISRWAWMSFQFNTQFTINAWEIQTGKGAACEGYIYSNGNVATLKNINYEIANRNGFVQLTFDDLDYLFNIEVLHKTPFVMYSKSRESKTQIVRNLCRFNIKGQDEKGYGFIELLQPAT
jgi:hypothetical protein